MSYFEHGYYPSWVPVALRDIIDRSELAEPNELIVAETDRLMMCLKANIAIYKKSIYPPAHHPNGLCTLYRSATLNAEQLVLLMEAEQPLKDYVIVAYADPLEPH